MITSLILVSLGLAAVTVAYFMTVPNPHQQKAWPQEAVEACSTLRWIYMQLLVAFAMFIVIVMWPRPL